MNRPAGRACLAAWLLFVVAPLAATGGETATKSGAPQPNSARLGFEGVDEGSVISADIRGRRFEDALPFDVQFFLQSPARADDREVSGWLKVLPRRRPGRDRSAGRQRRGPTPTPEECREYFPQPPSRPPGYNVPIVLVRRGDQDVAWAAQNWPPPQAGRSGRGDLERVSFSRILPAKPAADGQSARDRLAEVSVPAVPPNRPLCFEFEIESDSSARRDEIRRLLSTTIDTRLRRSPTSFDTPEALNELRRALLERLTNNLKPGERLKVRDDGSFFDPRVNLQGVTNRGLMDFSAIQRREIERRPAARNAARAQRDASEALQAILKSAGYKALVASQLARGDLEITGHEEILELDVDEAETSARAAVAFGSPALDGVFRSEGLDAAQATLNTTAQALLEVDRILVRRRTPLLREGEFDAAILNALASDIVSASVQFRRADRGFQELRRILDERTRGIERAVERLVVEMLEQVAVVATTTAGWQTSVSYYLGGDVGAGWAPELEDVFTYFGANIYFRPINKKASLSGSVWKRLSLMVGVTDEAIADDSRPGQLQGVIGNSPALMAGGYRISRHLRVSAGALVFKDTEPDPLIDDTNLAWSPFVSLSIDWNIRQSFSRFGEIFNLASE